MSTYTLTQVEPHVACMGEFNSEEGAIEWAQSIQDLGLCQAFTIGAYINKKFTKTYDSREKGDA